MTDHNTGQDTGHRAGHGSGQGVAVGPGGGVDHYAVLGVSRTASTAEVAAAYRRQVRRLHPDTHPDVAPNGGGHGDIEDTRDRVRALQQVLAAYAVLGDSVRRTRYDRDRASRRRGRTPTSSTPNMPGPSRTDAVWLGWRHPPGPGDPPLRAGPVRYHPR